VQQPAVQVVNRPPITIPVMQSLSQQPTQAVTFVQSVPAVQQQAVQQTVVPMVDTNVQQSVPVSSVQYTVQQPVMTRPNGIQVPVTTTTTTTTVTTKQDKMTNLVDMPTGQYMQNQQNAMMAAQQVLGPRMMMPQGGPMMPPMMPPGPMMMPPQMGYGYPMMGYPPYPAIKDKKSSKDKDKKKKSKKSEK